MFERLSVPIQKKSNQVDLSHFISLNKNRKTQKKISLLHKIGIFPKRVRYFVNLKLRYVIDKYLRRQLIRRFQIKPLVPVAAWKNYLETLQSVLDIYRLNLNADEVIRRSEDILNHRFSLLGRTYDNSELKNNKSSEYVPIPWHCDHGFGYMWSKDVWYRHSRKNVPDGTDIKLPWELSRCQHFILLGEAYNMTGDERYAREYCNQIVDWIKNNPVRYGPNWALTMEVGIRIANWIVALLYFVKSCEMNDVFFAMLLKSASEHGKHIMANLENISLITSNHYMGNISGLYVLSALCPVLKQSKKWKTFAKKELGKEIFRQTFEDGWDFESSTAYHRLVTEMFLYPFLLAGYLGEPFSDNYAKRLKIMIEVLGECAKPDGMVPQIGDNDNGRFLVFRTDRDLEDLRTDYLLETASSNSRIAPDVNGSKSVSYAHAGRYLFRNPRIYLMIASGPKGQAGNGGHAHNDILSFELNVDGEDIIVDPGTYCYTGDPEGRNRFRSVLSHNTLCWEGLEPCSFDKGLFMLPEEGVLKVEACNLGASEDFFSAVYEYKDRFHRREINFKKAEDEIEVRDSCSHEGAMLSFVCAPGIEPIIENSGFRAGKVSFSFDAARTIEIKPSQYSPAYGKLECNKVVRVHLSGKNCVCKINLWD